MGGERGDVAISSDQEPATKAIIAEVGRVRADVSSGKMVAESSPAGQSNGAVEMRLSSAEGQARMPTGALEPWRRD